MTSFNIADLYESLADAIPDRPVLVSGDIRYSFKELDEQANRVANALKARGIGHGDHVGLHLYNGHEFVEAMLALFKLRAVGINLNYRYVADELRYLCENADLKGVFTQRSLFPELAPAIEGVDHVKWIATVEDGSDARPTVPDGVEVFDYTAVKNDASPARDFEARTGDEHYIIYTGGTTGAPKGVIWRHEDVFFAGLQGGAPGDDPLERPEQLAERASDPDLALNILPAAPFIHGAAQWGAWIGIFTGGKLVLQPGRSFDAKRVAELIGEEGVTTITLVGDAMARPLADALAAGDYDSESLFVIASAGAVLSPVVKDALQEQLPDAMILNNFGSTEGGHQGSAYPGAETGTEGRPSFMMDDTCTVLDDDLNPIEPGSGKIGKLARTGRLPQGYYKDPVKTAERFKEKDGVRYVVPGDFATIEEDGRITVYGRGSVCINTGGEKVFPEEVEEVLKAHPDVFDALVVGVEDDRWMQRVVAVVQPKAGATPTSESIEAHCRDHIAGYKVPREIHFSETVARMPSGKPDYNWAKDYAAEQRASYDERGGDYTGGGKGYNG